MKTLIFLDYFSPAFKAGGPVRIFESVARNADRGQEVSIITQDRDLGDIEAFNTVPIDQWTHFEHARVLYSSADHRSFTSLRKLVHAENPEVIHLNSLFSRVWTMKLLVLHRMGLLGSCRVLISPHGELAESALGIKPRRKQIFLKLGSWLGLFQNLQWIATSEKEIDEIKINISSSSKIALSPPPLPEIHERQKVNKPSGTLKLVFLARLTAMKNIELIFETLRSVRGKVEFDIFGPVDPGYQAKWSEISSNLKSYPEEIKITYHGPLPSRDSQKTLSGFHLFAQPSLSENFGFSIVEALASGTPVLISDRTPWNEVSSAGIGEALSLEKKSAWIAALQRFIDMDETEWTEHSRRAQNWVRQKKTTQSDLLKIYELSDLPAPRKL